MTWQLGHFTDFALVASLERGFSEGVEAGPLAPEFPPVRTTNCWLHVGHFAFPPPAGNRNFVVQLGH